MKIYIVRVLSFALFATAAVMAFLFAVWDVRAFWDLREWNFVNFIYRLLLSSVIVCALCFIGIGMDLILTHGEAYPTVLEWLFGQQWELWMMIPTASICTHAIVVIYRLFVAAIKIFVRIVT